MIPCRVRQHFLPLLAVGLLMAAYVTIFGTMSLRRHQNLHTNALDLGYTDQAVWNTLHGRPFRFSTYLDAAFRLDIPLQEFREPEVLLGYHVEPILAAIAPLYLLHDGPETLLWLQTMVIALGAVPVYCIARQRLARLHTPGASAEAQHSPRAAAEAEGPMPAVAVWLPVAFVSLYLLSPSLEAANLSDFHAVALAPTLLLAAFYLLETGRLWGFAAFALLAAMCKEEVGLVVALMGLWAVLRKPKESGFVETPDSWTRVGGGRWVWGLPSPGRAGRSCAFRSSCPISAVWAARPSSCAMASSATAQ